MLAKVAPSEMLGRKARTITPTGPPSAQAASNSRFPLSTARASCLANGGGTGSPYLKDSSRRERGSDNSSGALRRTSTRSFGVNVREGGRRALPGPRRRRLPPHRRHRDGSNILRIYRAANPRYFDVLPVGYHLELHVPVEVP